MGEYELRVNKAIDYIHENPDRILSLEVLADKACFSKYHFHRIFKSVTKETINQYIKRYKMERAFKMIKERKNCSITDIALDLGFSSSSYFTNTFKDYFNVNPKKSKEKQYPYEDEVKNLFSKNKKSSPFDISCKIKKIDNFKVAYIRSLEGCKACAINEMAGRILNWGHKNKLFNSKSHVIGILYDDLRVTQIEKCMFDACIPVPYDIDHDQEVNYKTIYGGKYAVFSFKGSYQHIADYWDRIYSEWLPKSGFFPDDKPSLDFYLSNPNKSQLGEIEAQLHLPLVSC